MSVRVLDCVWRHAEAKGSDLLVLLSIADNADEDSGRAWPGFEYLAQKTRLSKRAVQYCVKRLLESGELVQVERGTKGKPNLYEVPTQSLRCKPDRIRRKAAQDSTQPVATEPSVEPSEGTTRSLVDVRKIQKVWDHYRTVRSANVERASDLPDEPPADEARMIRDAVKAAEGIHGLSGEDACCKAIDGLFGSDFHQRRGDGPTAKRRHTRLSDVLKAKRAGPHGTGYTLRERIDFFCERRDQQLRVADQGEEEDWRTAAAREQGL